MSVWGEELLKLFFLTGPQQPKATTSVGRGRYDQLLPGVKAQAGLLQGEGAGELGQAAHQKPCGAVRRSQGQKQKPQGEDSAGNGSRDLLAPGGS
ncbi:hypothetical protein EG19_00725 [Thermoanaerobaculum aquaticum]|uniref:Uncharacterized protein n=1 Tax=Thermoanaerobaculum aquaticum TaxID=1312852 RepID=A0A062XNG4_9BACT|nr:hypothetical protein EG19_00725 [Thermoanaerobaculum aquaticum]